MAEAIITFSFDVGDLNRLSQVSPEMAKFTRSRFKEGLEESGMLLTGLVATRTPVFSGNLRASIQWPQGYEFQADRSTLDSFRGIIGAGEGAKVSGVSGSTYVLFVEEDTKPHWPPIAPLKLYALRKWGDERGAYGLQRKIAQSGTTGKHMFRRAWDEGGKTKVEAIMKKIPLDVMQEFRNRANR